MAFTKTVLVGFENIDRKIIIEDSDENAEDDITGVNTSIIYSVEVDCSENPGEDVSVRFYGLTSPATADVGTDEAELLLPGVAGEVHSFACSEGLADFNTSGDAPGGVKNISVATVQEAGTTSGATAPSGTVKLTIWYKE
jgi:hypothetical protein